MGRLLALLFVVMALTASCSHDYITVQSLGVYADHLASMAIDTPDPRKKDPVVGEKLFIRWNIPLALFHKSDGSLYLIQTVRFGTMETEVKKYHVRKARGSRIYSLLGDEYFKKKGIATYKFELVDDGKLVEEWKHQIWVDYIDIDIDDELTHTKNHSENS